MINYDPYFVMLPFYVVSAAVISDKLLMMVEVIERNRRHTSTSKLKAIEGKYFVIWSIGVSQILDGT